MAYMHREYLQYTNANWGGPSTNVILDATALISFAEILLSSTLFSLQNMYHFGLQACFSRTFKTD